MTKNDARQSMLWAVQAFTHADFLGNSGVAVPAVELPQNAQVVDGAMVIDTAFNSATTDTMDIGDGVDTDRYTSTAPVNVAATGRTALSLDGYKYLTQDTIDMIWVGAGAAPTAGAGRLMVGYIVEGRAHHTQG